MAEVTNPGSVTVGQGYYNVDGTNIIKFTSPIKKTLTEAAVDLSDKNDIVLTLDSEGTSSFVLNGSDKTLTGYKKTYKLDSSSVYVTPSKQYILGTEPTGIDATATAYTTEYSSYYSLLGSPSIDSNQVFTATTYGNAVTWKIPSFSTDFTIISKQYCPESVTTSGGAPFTMSVSGSNTCFGIFQGGILYAYIASADASSMNKEDVKGHWVWLLFKVTPSKTYMYYIIDDNNIYTINTIPKDTSSTWALSSTDNDNNVSVFSNKTFYLGCNAYQNSSVIPDTKIDLVNTLISVDGVQYRIVEAPDNGSVSLTKGWVYSDGRTYHNKDTDALSVSTLIGNAIGTVGYKNKLQLGYEPSSDVSVPSISESLTEHAYDMNTDIYLDNTKSKILGTTALSDSWSGNYYTIESSSITFVKGYRYIDEIHGSFSIEADTTKTFEEAIVGDKAEQMGLYLINKTDLTTDFVLSATEPTTDVVYAEKLQDVNLDITV